MRIRPLAAVVVVPVVVGAAAAGLGLHAHFSAAPAAATQSTPSAAPATPAPQSAVVPPPRSGAALAWDAAHHVDVLFGGHGLQGDLADTWTWDGLSWQQLRPAQSPPVMRLSSAAWDPGRGRIVVVGRQGLDPTQGPPIGPSADWQTWTWDGSTWTRDRDANIASEGIADPPALGYDAAGRRLLAIAAVTDHSRTSHAETYAWENGQWTLLGNDLAIEGTPIAAAWDSADHTVRLLQASNGRGAIAAVHQWTWSGDTWRQQPDAPGVAGLQQGSATTSPFAAGVVQVDAAGVATWDGRRWSNARPATAPTATVGMSVAADPDRHTVILFGGMVANTEQRSLSNQTWTWDGHNWSSRGGALTPLPTPNANAGAADDACLRAQHGPPQTSISHIGNVFQAVVTLPPACATTPELVRIGVFDDIGTALAVRGNPMTLTTKETHFTLQWTNWCGGGPTYFGVAFGSASSSEIVRAPACVASGQPSTLRLVAQG